MSIGAHECEVHAFPVVDLLPVAQQPTAALLHQRFPTEQDAKTALSIGPGSHSFLLYDVTGPPYQLCYRGLDHQYESQLCPGEMVVPPGLRNRGNISMFNGGNGYDFRLVGPSVVWGPVVDHRDGSYSAVVRIEEEGEYVAEVHQNDRRGCHFADCDTPDGLCNAFKPYADRAEFCNSGVPSPCFTLVASRRVVVKRQGEAPAAKQLPACDSKTLGMMEGRWLRTDRMAPGASGPNTDMASWPYIWQPYDCSLRWPTLASVRECIHTKQLVFIGLSRERTNFFDVLEWSGIPFDFEKLKERASFENLHYLSLYSPQHYDARTWTWDPVMLDTQLMVIRDTQQAGICGNDTRPTHILATEEALWSTEVGVRDTWAPVTEATLNAITSVCPNARVHYKTATAARSQYRSLSWQRIWEETGVSIAVASRLGLPVIDSFQISQSVVADAEAFPDGLHPFDPAKKLRGNFVSRTASMMFLIQVCPDLLQR